jgi:hypothetical protein
MWFNGDFAHDLLIEGHSAGCPAQSLQQLVVISLTPAQAVTMQIKGHPGDED